MKGLTTVLFNQPSGNIRLYLPDDIRPGEIISGSIYIDAAGKNAKQVAANQHILQQQSIQFNGHQIAVSSSSPKFTISASADINTGEWIRLINASGISSGEVRVNTNPKGKMNNSSLACSIPTHALTASPMRITGPFDGNSSNTQCTIGGREAELLTESPRQANILFLPNLKGLQSLEVKEKGVLQCNGQVSAVDLQVTAGKMDLLRGEKTTIEVVVTGLQNLPDTAMLTLDNITRDVVYMQPSDQFNVALTNANTAKGVYQKTFAIQSIRAGRFTVNVNLDLPPREEGFPPVWADNRGTNADGKQDTVPCLDKEAALKAGEEALKALQDELSGIGSLIHQAKYALRDCNEELKKIWEQYHDLEKKHKDIAELKSWRNLNPSRYTDAQKEQFAKELEAAKTAKDEAAKKYWDQKKKCDDLEARIKALQAREKELPGLISAAEEAVRKAREEAEKCKTKEQKEKKKKEEEERRRTEAQPPVTGETTQPGDDGTKAGKPCQPEGIPYTEQKRLYGPCYADDVSLNGCNMGKLESKVLDAIKEILKKLKPLAKPVEIAEKIAQCGSLAKAFCVSVTVKRDWEDVELKFECVNGKWVQVNRKSLNKGTEVKGTYEVIDKEVGVCCWIFGKKSDGESAMDQHLAEAIQNLLEAKGCK